MWKFLISKLLISDFKFYSSLPKLRADATSRALFTLSVMSAASHFICYCGLTIGALTSLQLIDAAVLRHSALTLVDTWFFLARRGWECVASWDTGPQENSPAECFLYYYTIDPTKHGRLIQNPNKVILLCTSVVVSDFVKWLFPWKTCLCQAEMSCLF